MTRRPAIERAMLGASPFKLHHGPAGPGRGTPRRRASFTARLCQAVSDPSLSHSRKSLSHSRERRSNSATQGSCVTVVKV